jgi:hypothetical protein
MGVIKVETFDVTITNNLDTHTLTNDVGNLDYAFVRVISSTDKGFGPTGSTGNANPNVVGCAAQLTATDTITFYKTTSTAVRVMGEVWRYTGSAGGADEFIVRGRHSGIVTGTEISVSTSGIVDRNKVTPIYQGFTTASTSVSDYETCTLAMHVDSTNSIIFSRNNSGTSVTGYGVIVEWIGSNWKVGHGFSDSHDSTMETVTLNEDSAGEGGLSFDVGDWSRAMIIDATMEGDSTETGLADVQAAVYPGSTTSTIQFGPDDYDGNSANDGKGYAHVIVNSSLIVNRASNTNLSEGNGTTGTAPFPVGSSTSESLDELSLEWFVGTSGTGTAHARGRLTARITAASGTITHWVHRSGNNVRVDYGVVELAALDNLANVTINSVDGDNIVSNTQNGVIILGLPFEAVQGTGKIELVENNNYTGTIVLQSVTSWANGSITVDITGGALADSNCFLFVTTDSGARGFISVQVGIPPVTFIETIELTGPDHLHPLDNNYTDIIAGSDFNQTPTGSPSFVLDPLCKDMSYSWQINNTNDKREQPDSAFTNVTNQHTDRDILFYLKLDRFYKNPVHFLEEGGGVNNMYFIVGPGNILLVNVADSNKNFKVQAIGNVVLEPGRVYCLGLHMHAVTTANQGRVDVSVDGIIQNTTIGNPISVTTNGMSTHSGDRCIGQPDGTLDTGGTDIQYVAAVGAKMAMISTYSAVGGGAPLSISNIRTEWVEKGALPGITIVSDTQVNMQAALNAFASTVRPNEQCNIEIQSCTDGDFELENPGITFNENSAINVNYLGGDTLTWVNTSGGSIDQAKIGTPNLGTVNVIETVITTITGIPIGAEWRLGIKSPTVGLSYDTELAGEENKADSNDILYSDRYSTDTQVILQVMADGFVEFSQEYTLGANPQTIIVTLLEEKNAA